MVVSSMTAISNSAASRPPRSTRRSNARITRAPSVGPAARKSGPVTSVSVLAEQPPRGRILSRAHHALEVRPQRIAGGGFPALGFRRRKLDHLHAGRLHLLDLL